MTTHMHDPSGHLCLPSAYWRQLATCGLIVGALPLTAAAALGQCVSEPWLSFQGVAVRHVGNQGAYFFVTAHMAVDADGAPNAYHPNDIGLDRLANAGFPDGGWRNVLVADPNRPGRPFVQGEGPFQGFFLSKTALEDRMRPATDSRRYVDATSVAYLVFPGAFHRLPGTGTLGDLGVAFNIASGETTPFVVADIGPTNAALGEVSIQLAEALGGRAVSPATGAGMPRGSFAYVVFPRSRRRPAWPLTSSEIEAAVDDLVSARVGRDALERCIAS